MILNGHTGDELGLWNLISPSSCWRDTNKVPKVWPKATSENKREERPVKIEEKKTMSDKRKIKKEK